MSEIKADEIDRWAQEVLSKLKVIPRTGSKTELVREIIALAIRGAVMAERERCASVALKYEPTGDEYARAHRYEQSQWDIAREAIAKLILG